LKRNLKVKHSLCYIVNQWKFTAQSNEEEKTDTVYIYKFTHEYALSLYWILCNMKTGSSQVPEGEL